jgi:hypothetical protein
MEINFKKDFEGDRLEVANGDYRRTFERAAQPFKVEAHEWQMLRRTGAFERVTAPAAPAADNNSQLAQGGEQQGQQGRQSRRGQKVDQGEQPGQ